MSKVRNSSLNILKAICCILIVFNHCKFPSVFGKLLKNYYLIIYIELKLIMKKVAE